MLTFEDLLRLENKKIVNGNKLKGVRFTGVSIDSRKCKKSELFFAIKGGRFDGHDFILDVFKKSIKAVIAEKSWYSKLKTEVKARLKGKSLILVNDTVKTLGELARNYRRKFPLVPVLAVGGSNGKTTTRDILARVLSCKYKVLKTENNLNNQFGVPLTLFRLTNKHEFCVIELGTNHFGEIQYLCRIVEPQFGVITNIGKEHLEFFKNLKGAAKAEGEMIEYLRKRYGTFFLNYDDKYLISKVGKSYKNYFTYAVQNSAEVKGKILGFKKMCPVVKIKYKNYTINTKLNSIGIQSFYSALCAAAIGYYFEVASGKIRKAITDFKTGTKRRNDLLIKNGVYVIDDSYNSNPDSVRIALENLSSYKLTMADIHLVLADMLELGKSSRKEHTSVGRLIHKMNFKNLYTYGAESYYTFQGARGIKNNFYFSDKPTLIEFLKLNLKKGDLVLIKGSHSMKMEEVTDAL
ncbi:MAG: UDP-N-acetylmuramoyl-tripeptide--D-alanyl-D-alanine ligase [Ignavibacteria bacterium]